MISKVTLSLFLATVAVGCSPAPHDSGTCTNLQGTVVFNGGTCGTSSTCTLTQTGCSLALNCSDGSHASGTASGAGFQLTLVSQSGSSAACTGSLSGETLSASCSSGSKSCTAEGSFTSAGDAGGSADKFLGPRWAGTRKVTTTCGGSTTTSSSVAQVKFNSLGPDAIGYTGANGCVFAFTVSGDTATLSNAPVSCNVADGDAGIDKHEILTQTWTTADGQHLTGRTTGSDTLNGSTCTFVADLTYSR